MKRCTARLATCTRRWQAGRRPARSLARWRAISLRWRRAGRRAAGAPAVLRPLCVHHVWAPRFHFHEQGAAPAARASAIDLRFAPAARLLVWSKPATASTNVANAPRLSRGLPTSARVLRRTTISRPSERLAPPAARAGDVTKSAKQLRGTPPRARANAVATADRSGIVHALVHRAARITRLIPAAEAGRQAARLPVAMAPRHAALPRLGFASPAPLHWRKNEAASSLAAAPASLGFAPAHVSPRANETAAAPAMSSAADAATTREAIRREPLDAAVADRLVEDVVRRIEKRVRIERERRGL